MKFDAGRVIAYGGGGGVTATSHVARANPAGINITPTPGDVVTLLNMPLMELGGVQVVTADVVSVGGLVFVGLRLAFDIYRHLEARRGRRDAD